MITVTEIRITRVNDRGLLALCDIILENVLAIKAIKVIDRRGDLFIVMPSRPKTFACRKCGTKATVISKFCGECGGRFEKVPSFHDNRGRLRIYDDIVHPIQRDYRNYLTEMILDIFERFEVEDYDYATYTRDPHSFRLERTAEGWNNAELAGPISRGQREVSDNGNRGSETPGAI